MIEIINKKDCCGCSACVQKCPKQCIILKEDNEGFLYPAVDKGICIDCGLCEKVCPVLHQGDTQRPLNVYAAKNQNEEVRKQSSSGGIYTLLAEQVIQEGGVVFGARFDENWEVKHDFTETVEGLAVFRGSKYVQSRIEDNYKKAEEFLKQGKKVLFSGTPCQVAGLKGYLGINYSSLITVACACHGVPSPMVWNKFLNQIVKGRKIKNINFRDKSTGWKHYSFFVSFSNGESYNRVATEVPYMKAFIKSLIERPSCENCKFKRGQSGADFVLADYWGISDSNKVENDDKGCGLVLVYNESSSQYLNDENITLHKILEEEIGYNGAFLEHITPHNKRNYFFMNLNDTNCLDLLDLCLKKTFKERIKQFENKIKLIIRRFL